MRVFFIEVNTLIVWSHSDALFFVQLRPSSFWRGILGLFTTKWIPSMTTVLLCYSLLTALYNVQIDQINGLNTIVSCSFWLEFLYFETIV